MTRSHVAARCCVLWSVVPLLVLGAAATEAQCPDGTPPPCKGGVPTVLRRANPALDQRAWIVVPFTNITKAQELDWLREASVNLLSLDLSRWTDISVVDDKRVADLVRELPSAFGQLQLLTKSLESRAVDEQWSPERARYWRQAPRAMLGLPTDSLARDERLYWEHAVGDILCEAGRPRCRATLLWPSMAYAARAPRSWWPFRGTSVAGFRFFVPFFFARGDTARVRAIARWTDSLSARYFMAGSDDQGMSIQAVEAALVLRDSATALRGTRWFVDSLMPPMNRMSTSLDDEWGYLIIPRLMLQRADLAAALGRPDEARIWYTRMRDLWTEADPELQPAVATIRAALAALGPSRQ